MQKKPTRSKQKEKQYHKHFQVTQTSPQMSHNWRMQLGTEEHLGTGHRKNTEEQNHLTTRAGKPHKH